MKSRLRMPLIITFSVVLVLGSVFMLFFSEPSIKTGDGTVPSEPSSADASPSDTSVADISSTEPPLEPEAPDCITIQMGGDVLLHDSVLKAAKTGDSSYGYISDYFSLFNDIFVSDLNIVNLEGPVDANGKNRDVKGYPVFNMPYEILTVLKNINVDVCITANNHTCDMGFKGVESTVKNVKKAGMTPIGSYATEEASAQCYVTEINNIKVGIAAFTTYTEGSVKSEKSFCVNKTGKSETQIVNAVTPAIDELKENGAEFIIIALHWGTEYDSMPSEAQKNVAAQLCSYGADVIMGSHSHCVQPIEVLTVKRGDVESRALVIYSLGNLFTNQTGLNKAKTQEGMVVSLKAVRDEDGCVRIEDAFYMPTYTYVRGGKGKNFMKIVPAGEYATAEEMPSFFKDSSGWKKCKNAWSNVTSTVGSAIPAIYGAGSYPDGFFPVSNSDVSY